MNLAPNTRPHLTRNLRGGWIAKRGKHVLTSPSEWGGVLALGAVLGATGPASAGDVNVCIPSGTPPSLVWECSGPLSETEVLTIPEGGDGTIRLLPGFSADTTGNAVVVVGEAGSNGIVLTDTSQGAIRAASGIVIVQQPDVLGDVTVSTNSTFTTTAAGILVTNDGASGDIIITADGPVTMTGSEAAAIGATHSGPFGVIEINVNADVSALAKGATAIAGLRIADPEIDADTALATGMDDADDDGDDAGDDGDDDDDDDLELGVLGDVTITAAKGAHVAVGASGTGIMAVHQASGSISITADTISAGQAAHAILAEHFGNGGITITTHGKIEVGDSGFGVKATHSGEGSVEITAEGDVLIGDGLEPTGLIIEHDGKGDATLTAQGAVTVGDGNGSTGIGVLHGSGFAIARAPGDSLALSEGHITIAANGAVDVGDGEDARGVAARHGGAGNVVITTTSSVTVGDGEASLGVGAEHSGTGEMTITTDGAVIVGDGAKSVGVGAARFAGGDGDITITAKGPITVGDGAEARGLAVAHAMGGTGAVTVTASGAITVGDGEEAAGIVVDHEAEGDVILTSTGPVTVGKGLAARGIWARQIGKGNVQVTSEGDVVLGDGAAARGIQANAAEGFGAVTLTAKGRVTVGDGNNALGIFGLIENGVGDLTISTTGDITVGDGKTARGVEGTINKGVGNVGITTGGAVTIGDGDRAMGVFGLLLEGEGDVLITTQGSVTVGNGTSARGIEGGIADGEGDVIITTAADVTVGDGAFANGIFALTSLGEGDVVVTTGGAVTVGDGELARGINARVAQGAGDVKITANGAVSVGHGDDAGGILGAVDRGDGDVTIVSTKTVTVGDGLSARGIMGTVLNLQPATLPLRSNGNVTITATGDVIVGSGVQARGLYGLVQGEGTVTVTSSGNVHVGATAFGVGVFGHHLGEGDIVITTSGTVTSGFDGIVAMHEGKAGDVHITTQGTVTGGDGAAIYVNNGAGNNVIALGAASDVSAASELAIIVEGGATELTLAGTLSGSIWTTTGALDDQVTIQSTAKLAGLTGIDVGAGDDRLDVAGWSGQLAGPNLTGFEVIALGTGARVDFGAGVKAASRLELAAGSTLLMTTAAGSRFDTPRLLNSGLIQTGLQTGTLTGHLEGTGTLETAINFETGAHGQFNVDGGLAAGSVQTITVTPLGAGLGERRSFPVLTFGETVAGEVRLGTSTLDVGAMTVDLVLAGPAQTAVAPNMAMAKQATPVQPSVFSVVIDKSRSRFDVATNPVAAAMASQGDVIGDAFVTPTSMGQRQGSRTFGSGAGSIGLPASRALTPVVASQGTLGGSFASPTGPARTVTLGQWALIEGDRFSRQPSTGQRIKGTMWRFEGGFDTALDIAEDGVLVVGAGIMLGTASAQFSAGGGAAKASANATGLSLTASYFASGGTYLDAELRATQSRSKLQGPTGAVIASGIRSSSVVGKLELGHRFALDAQSVLTPSVQVALGQVKTRGYQTTLGDTIAPQTERLSELRLGLDYDQTLANGGNLAVFGAFTRDLAPTSSVTVNGITQVSSGPRNWAEAGLRLGTVFQSGAELRGELGYRAALGSRGSGNTNAFARLGLNFNW